MKRQSRITKGMMSVFILFFLACSSSEDTSLGKRSMKHATGSCTTDDDCPGEWAPPCHEKVQGTCEGGKCVYGVHVADDTSCEGVLPCVEGETCLNGNCQGGTPVADGTPCPDGLCHNGECSETECYIDGTWYNAGDKNPTNECEECNPQESRTAWSPVFDGSPCSVGICKNGTCNDTECYIDDSWYADGTINPANECDKCDVTVNQTDWTPVTNGTSCDDGLFCTVGETCQNGVCTGGTSPCLTDDPNTECIDEGMCNEDTDDCGGPTNEGGSCDDGLFCTVGEACEDGVCTGGTSPCPADDPNTECIDEGMCNEDTDKCGEFAENGTSCDDGFFCTEGETCQNGECTGGTSPCQDDLDTFCLDEGVCNEETDECESEVINEDQLCDDKDLCTENTTCQDGLCQGGEPVICDRGNPCEKGDCDPELGCVYTALDDVPCDDGNDCTKDDYCEGGECVAKSFAKEGTECNDGNPCTEGEKCDKEGKCIPEKELDGEEECDDGNECTTKGKCKQGVCEAEPVADGTECDDDNPCTEEESCQGGVCVGKTLPNGTECKESDNPCVTNFVCNFGACEAQLVEDGTPCELEDKCIRNPVCEKGKCVGEEIPGCRDAGPKDVGPPDVAKPDVAKPDVAKPDVAKPDVAKPDVAKPDARPEVGPERPEEKACECTKVSRENNNDSIFLVFIILFVIGHLRFRSRFTG